MTASVGNVDPLPIKLPATTAVARVPIRVGKRSHRRHPNSAAPCSLETFEPFLDLQIEKLRVIFACAKHSVLVAFKATILITVCSKRPARKWLASPKVVVLVSVCCMFWLIRLNTIPMRAVRKAARITRRPIR